jgi:hypothetical protein
MLAGTLMAPGAVAVSYDGTLTVPTGTVFGPGAGTVVRSDPEQSEGPPGTHRAAPRLTGLERSF